MNGNEIGSIIQHNRNGNNYSADALTHTLNNANKIKDHEAVAKSGAAGFTLNVGEGMGQGMMPLTDTDKKSAASALRQVTSGAPEDVMKDKMIVMSNTMSDEAYKKAAENGYSLSDMDPEEAVTIADEIKITMAKSGVVIKGYNDDLTTEQLEAVTGSAAMANEISESLHAAGVPATESNVKDMNELVDMADSLKAPSREVKNYLVENELPPTIQNLYYAEHSVSGAASSMRNSGSAGNPATDRMDSAIDSSETIKKQIEKIIKSAGFEADTENYDLAKQMVHDGLILDEKSFTAMRELQDMDFPIGREMLLKSGADAIASGLSALQADPIHEGSLIERAIKAADVVETAASDARYVRELVDRDMLLNVKNLAAVTEELPDIAEADKVSVSSELTVLDSEQNESVQAESQVLMAAADNSGSDAKYITAYRRMEEVRLSMTVEANLSILRMGVDIDITELSDLVDRLKLAEAEINKKKFGTEDNTVAAERASIYNETMQTVSELPKLPVSVIGSVVIASKEEALFRADYGINNVTLEDFSARGHEQRNRYELAGEAYESLQTEVRADLGDSIQKAFAYADSLLNELGIEASESNLRAARVLGYNHMEINSENIALVDEACSVVDNIIEKMNPAATLDMIRNGINPMKLSMKELEEKLDALEAEDTGEKYSEYLVRMQDRGLITDEEAESFVGIYRMMHQTELKDGAAIGKLLSQGREVSFTNILSAIRSGHSAGMDVSVDDGFGGMESNIDKNIEAQIETAFRQVQAESMAENIRDAADASTQIYRELVESEVIATAEHVKGLKRLRSDRGEVFDDIRKIASAGGDDWLITSSYKRVLDNFDNEDSAKSVYNEIMNLMGAVVRQFSAGEGEDIDVRQYSLTMAQLSVAGSLSKNESYEIPMEIDGSLTSVTVKILHGSGKTPATDISLKTEKFGSIKARFEMSGDGTGLTGLAVSDREGAADALQALSERLLSRFAENGLNVTEFSFVISSRTDVNLSGRNAEKNNSNVDTASLYRTAKTFLQTVGEA